MSRGERDSHCSAHPLSRRAAGAPHWGHSSTAEQPVVGRKDAGAIPAGLVHRSARAGLRRARGAPPPRAGGTDVWSPIKKAGARKRPDGNDDPRGSLLSGSSRVHTRNHPLHPHPQNVFLCAAKRSMRPHETTPAVSVRSASSAFASLRRHTKLQHVVRNLQSHDRPTIDISEEP